MPGWFRSRARAKPRPIDPALWRRATSSWLFMRGVTAEESERLRAISERFLHSKSFAGTHDLEVTEEMRVAIAAQACILVLELGEEWYEGWSDIIVYPDAGHGFNADYRKSYRPTEAKDAWQHMLDWFKSYGV